MYCEIFISKILENVGGSMKEKKTTRTVAYLRISPDDQNFDSQRGAIQRYAQDKRIVIDNWKEETGSGGKEIPVFENLLHGTIDKSEQLKKGDTLVVYALNRLSRRTVELLETLETLNKNGVKLHSVVEQFSFESNVGTLIVTLMAALAEFERSILRQRQKEGIEAAKKRGAYAGRQYFKLPNAKDFEICYQNYTNLKSYTLVRFQEAMNMKESTLLKFIKMRKELNQPFPDHPNLTLKDLQNLLEPQKQARKLGKEESHQPEKEMDQVLQDQP